MKKDLKILLLFCLMAMGGAISAQKLYQVRGTIYESDSSTVIPFAYVINDCTHNGVISDMYGKFVISANENDSIHISFLGYDKTTFRVNKIPNENDSTKVYKRFYMTKKTYDMAMVYVNAFKIKPHERDYMNRVINRPKVSGINVIESPITALWQTFSKKGREMQKLEKIFEEVLRKEAIEKKVNTELLRKLLNEPDITMEKFRIQCPEISDDFILYTSGYELYNSISEAYKYYKKRTKSGG